MASWTPSSKVTCWPTLEESPRQRMLRERRERKALLLNGPSPATVALRRAMKWQEDIESTGITRADIARREGLSRARGTQIISLLDLPEEMRASLLAMDRCYSRKYLKLRGSKASSSNVHGQRTFLFPPEVIGPFLPSRT